MASNIPTGVADLVARDVDLISRNIFPEMGNEDILLISTYIGEVAKEKQLQEKQEVETMLRLSYQIMVKTVSGTVEEQQAVLQFGQALVERGASLRRALTVHSILKWPVFQRQMPTDEQKARIEKYFEK